MESVNFQAANMEKSENILPQASFKLAHQFRGHTDISVAADCKDEEEQAKAALYTLWECSWPEAKNPQMSSF